ncbi:MAG: DNA recombination protein RmuC [Bacteroidales bacterium]|nr:DNA recombination protein RmuC [Bacteroidales bacterium]
MITSIIIAICAGAAAGVAVWLISRSIYRSQMEVRELSLRSECDAQVLTLKKELESQAMLHQSELNAKTEALKKEKESAQEMVRQAQENYEKALKEMKETVVSSMTAETEKLLKTREKELKEGNQTNMDGILKPLKESISAMEKAMKDNADSHLKSTTELSEQLKRAVKDMQEKTSDVGRKADTLSEALTGKPKVQGCFGENFLDAILAGEGLQEGTHYTREAANDDLSRPDFVFHFKDGYEEKDLVVDSKVSLTAFVDYMNAATPEDKASALDRHIKSVRKHIDELSRKEYAKKRAKSFADYVLMFMPRDMAFRVALEADPMLWQEAYQKNVLIATEQTIMPFLKIIQLTWNKFQQDTNTQKITTAAQNMIDRVGAFYDAYIDLGKKLKSVTTAYNSGISKLKEGGQSITTSAKQVMELGIKRSKGKEFIVPDQMIEIESDNE